MRQAALVLVIAGLATACGSEQQASAPSVLPPTVARVGSATVSVEEVQTLLADTSRSFELQGRPFPPEGSPYYLDLRDEGVRYLVERNAHEQEADRLNVEVSDDEIDREIAAIARKDVREATRRTGLTTERLRQGVRDRLVDRGIFKALIGHADETDNLSEAKSRFKERLRAVTTGTEYAEGWAPAKRPRSPVPPELQDLPKPDGPCDLKEGTFTFREAWTHGCAAKWGLPAPGRDGPLCPDVPVDMSVLGGFTAEEAEIGYELWVIDDNAPSCVPYPSTKVTVRTGFGPCFPSDVDDPCMKKGRIRQTWITLD